MPEGKFCNRRPINTEEDLKALLGDKGGQQYYKEMEMLEVDTVALWETLQKTCKSRTRTWLEICAHCGLCANSCFLYTANNRDPKQVPSYKIQSTLGEMLRRKGQVDTKFMIDTMEVAWAKCTCCNRCGTYCPHGIDMGVMFSYLRGVLYSQGFVPWELKIGAGMHRVYGAQMDVTTEDWVDTCEWMAEENAEEWPGLEIPIDKEDCDVMYILNAREPKHYPEDVAQAAIQEMYRQTGPLQWGANGVLQRGLMVRHLLLPGCRKDSMAVLEALSRLAPPRHILLSLMSQYTPCYRAAAYKEIDRRVTDFEIDSVRDYAVRLGFEGYGQARSAADSRYTPAFDLTGVW